eukprot:2937329-Rhodomonas_salina.1
MIEALGGTVGCYARADHPRGGSVFHFALPRSNARNACVRPDSDCSPSCSPVIAARSPGVLPGSTATRPPMRAVREAR